MSVAVEDHTHMTGWSKQREAEVTGEMMSPSGGGRAWLNFAPLSPHLQLILSARKRRDDDYSIQGGAEDV